MFFTLVLLLLVLLVLVCTLAVVWRHCTYWQRQGICGPNGWPLFGNMSAFFCGYQHYGVVYESIYKRFTNLPFVGIYQLFNEPAILVRSQALIKDILIRNFQHFQNNALWIDEQRDPIITFNPFVAKDDEWRRLRAELAPMFTPTKVKNACTQIDVICKDLKLYVAKQLRDGERLEAKNLCSKYTLAVVAAVGFGLNARTFSDMNSDFTHLIEPLFAQHSWSLLETTALLFSPLLGRIIRYRYMPLNVQHWLQQIIGTLLSQRLDERHSSVKPNDFIQWLIEQNRRQHKTIERTNIVGHCGTLLLEGFETSATLMAFTLYELARHPHIQKRVQREIDEVWLQHNGNGNTTNNNVIRYEMLQQLNYLEATLYETLRLHPVMQALFKRCTRTFTLPTQCADGQAFTVPASTLVVIPVNAIHLDETLYPEPLQFNPERFYGQAERQHLGCRFLGFGEGPRMCPGMRFGLAQSKAGLVTLLRDYNVHLANAGKGEREGENENEGESKREQRVKIAASTFLTAAANGIWLRFASRA